jgi:hypothetical protein
VADDLYDELTRRRIDGAGHSPRTVAGPARRAIGGGALLTAVALGVQEALEPRRVEPIVEEIDAADDDLPAVSLYLVRGYPARSRAIVRPWLLG